MDKMTALYNMKSALCEALRADLEAALNINMRLRSENEELKATISELREQIAFKNKWYYHVDKDVEYQNQVLGVEVEVSGDVDVVEPTT